jgi:hypothetical protein
MACREINLTKEEVTNVLINKGVLFDITPEDKVSDILDRYKYLQDVMELPSGDNARYSIFGQEIKERFSNIAKKAYESRIGSTFLERTIQEPDFIRKKDAGSRVHEILADLMLVKLGQKKKSDVISKARVGDYAVSGDNIKELENLVDEVYEDIQKLQKEIDPEGKVTILVEQRILDPVQNRGGTMDIHAVFSDGTGLIYDYKTTHSKGDNYQFGQLVDDLLHENKIADNELTMAEYKRIAIHRMGVKKIRQTRLIPVHLRLALKPESEWKDFDYRTKEIELIEAGSRTGRESDQFLKPIPVAGEETKYAGINELLEKQFILLKNLNNKLDKDTLNADERDRLKHKISTLRRSIRKTLTDGEIYDIIESATDIIAEIKQRIHIPQFDGKDKPNSLYIDNEELIELMQEISIYTDIIENTSIYYRDLQNEDPEEFQKLRKAISTIASEVDMALTDVKQELNKRTLESVVEDAKDEQGNLKPLTELDYLTRNFTRISEIDHPIFRSAWQLIQDKLFEQRQELKKISDNIEEKDKAVASWAKATGISKLDAFRKIIDFSTGNLINKLSKELYDKVESAYTNPDLEKGYKELRKYLMIKDENKFKENFDRRYKNYKERMKYKYMDDPIKQKKAIDTWYLNNNLLDSEVAWTSKYNRKYLIFKPEVEEANLSKEYQEIQNIKPLLDYYNMYRKYNDEFRGILGLSNYNKLPSNFIPNIRKSMTESIATENIQSAFKYITTEFWDSFNVREEDMIISDRDSSGDLKRTIPILYLNPLRNKNNEIDNTKKSYDLSKNLLLFSKMVYNHKSMSEIEPVIIGMKELMANPTAEQGGTQVLDANGRKVLGNIREYAMKKGFDTDTYKLFEDLMDYYLYGIKFKSDNSLGNSARLTKILLKLKNYYAKKALSFAVIPGIGAYMAGNVASFFEGVKGVNYTKQNILDAGKNKVKEFHKFKALSLFFDVYAEDPTNALMDAKSANFFTRIGTTRNMFYPLRKTDELINDELANRLALNWGIDTENKLGLGKNALIRLNRPDIDTTGIKSIWELTTLDKKTGKLTIEGIIDKDGNIINKDAYIAFRNAVKATSASIIGSLSQEDISRIDTNLIFSLMFQFKTWMPGIVKERFGELRYDERLQSVRWGRYRAAFAEYGLSSSEIDGAQKINNFWSQIVLPNMGRMVLDLITFGVAFKTGLGGVSSKYTDKFGKIRRIRSNAFRAKRMYYDWILKNKLDPNKVTFEMYLETKEGQMKAMMVELRTILSFMTILLFLGGDGDDGEPRYMDNYITRLLFKTMSKANSELTFVWSPIQMAQIIKNPIPMSAMFTDVIKLTKNTFDEGRDIIFGENSPYDKSPAFFYTLQMAYGGNQLARFLELYKQYEKNPYVLFDTGR